MKLTEAIDQVRDKGCTLCKQSNGADRVCVMGAGYKKAGIMVVTARPSTGKFREELWEFLAEANFEPGELFYTSAIKCVNWDANVSNPDIKVCRTYLEQEIKLVRPKWILAFGNEALFALTGHSGITKYRGKVIEHEGHSVFPTISPGSVARNPGQRPAFMADLHLFNAAVHERSSKVPPPDVAYIMTKEQLKPTLKWLETADLVSYDVETTGDGEFTPESALVSLSMTCVHRTEKGQHVSTAVIPMFHPESPFRLVWRQIVELLRPGFKAVKKQIAHNGKYDARWMRRFGCPEAKVTFDTMLAAHLLDENRQKGLKPQAASRLGVAPWGIDTRSLLNTPLRQVLEYNGLDTYYTYHIYLQLREELIAQPRLLRIFQFLTIPANEKYIEAERRGVWIDREVLATSKHVCEKMMEDIVEKLMEFVPGQDGSVMSPEELLEIGWPMQGRVSKTGRFKLAEVNFRPTNFARWLLFDYLQCPVLARGKNKPDGSPGDPSMKEDVLMELRDQGFKIAAIMLERARWQQMLQFCVSYDEMADENDRIHTSFKLAGTVTGRTSSGKEDAEKLTGMRDIRGVNIQQVPRAPIIRGIFGAEEDWWLIEADYSQVELRWIAQVAPEPTMLHLYRTGQDIHRATAAWVLGIPPEKIDKDQRKKAKAVNFGFAYGMYPKKFVHTAYVNYDAVFSLDEATAVRRQFFERFSGLEPWHRRQRRLVHEHARVQSPIGRVRHLPDIRSPEQGVRMEAERQAVNAPIQSVASDMLLLAMVLIDDEFKRRGISDKAHIVGTVHDAALFEVHHSMVKEVLPMVKRTMEHLPLNRKFGVNLSLPMVADLKIGKHWGGAVELTTPQVKKFKFKYLEAAQ